MYNLRNMKFRILYIYIIAIVFVSCGEGYEKTDGKWTWVLHSEAGKHVVEINADDTTFKKLENPAYAKDKNRIYWRGIEIENADPKTFEVITENGYSKDKNNVYLDNEMVIFANPNTFKVIEWPYSKDDKKIFNGNLPMDVDNIKEFEITKSGGLKNSTMKSFFIEWNHDYKWLDTINVKGIIVGENAEARTKSEKHIGFRKIK